MRVPLPQMLIGYPMPRWSDEDQDAISLMLTILAKAFEPSVAGARDQQGSALRAGAVDGDESEDGGHGRVGDDAR